MTSEYKLSNFCIYCKGNRNSCGKCFDHNKNISSIKFCKLKNVHHYFINIDNTFYISYVPNTSFEIINKNYNKIPVNQNIDNFTILDRIKTTIGYLPFLFYSSKLIPTWKLDDVDDVQIILHINDINERINLNKIIDVITKLSNKNKIYNILFITSIFFISDCIGFSLDFINEIIPTTNKNSVIRNVILGRYI
jgi:hypothetical protein